MTSKLFWLGSALCGALLVNGCSSSDNGDGGTTTTAGTGGSTTSTASGGSTTSSHASSSGSTTASASAGGTSSGTNAGSSTGSSTGTSTGTGATGSGTNTGTSTGSSTGGSVIGMSCDPTASPDTTCAPTGYYCDPNTNKCIIPVELAPCLGTVGCNAGFTCTPGFGNGGSVSLCLQNCAVTTDCKLTFNSCVQLSGTNVCAPQSCGSGTASGGDAYLPCNSSGTNDGTCYTVLGGTNLFCDQAGSVALNQPCGSSRADETTLCGFESTCVGFGGTSSACLSLCAGLAPTLPDGGPGCGPNDQCVALGQGFTWGVCILGCTALTDCPSPYTQCVGLTGLTGTFCVP